MKRITIGIGICLLLLATAVAVWLMLANRNPDLDQTAAPVTNHEQQLAQGKYLARVGNCMSCHTARGGAAYAGGRAIPTPFGTIYASNLTPDPETGLGNWNSDDFWRAMHDGRSRDGSLLYPAFPYTNYTKVTRADADAIFAWLQTLPAVKQKNRAPELRAPFDNRALLLAWRALYFRPGQYQEDSSQSVEWNRGAYLVQGLGHCSACHSTRDRLGGIGLKAELEGGLIPSLNWYAPALNADSLATWEQQHLAAFLKNGVTPQRAVTGPMAEVVANSLQYLTQEDVQAMASYLKMRPADNNASITSTDNLQSDEKQAIIASGARLYENQCVNCHQASGQGIPSVYPALAGNQAVTAPLATNPIRLVLHGGFAPSTDGNPRPYGMPPFGQIMTDAEIAAVVSYIRNAWGNQASAVSAHEVNQYRSQEGL